MQSIPDKKYVVSLAKYRLFTFIGTLVLLLSFAQIASGDSENLALGKEVQLSPASNYLLTAKGSTDAYDLTDGRLSQRQDDKIWFDSGAVGFSYPGLVQLALDLGQEADIAEVAIRFQGGSPQAGISVPCWVDLVASHDGKQYYRVASYSRWTPGDRGKFHVPPDKGEPWLHKLRFENTNIRARYIGLSFYGTGLSVSDELWVIAGPKEARYKKVSNSAPVDFSVTSARMYFHKPIIYIPMNIDAPTPIGLIVPPAAAGAQTTVEIELPKKVCFTGGFIGRQSTTETQGVTSPDGQGMRYRFDFTSDKSNKTWSRVYLRSELSDGQSSTIRYRLHGKSEKSPWISQEILSIRIPPVEAPKRLMTGLGWWSFSDTLAWPNALEAYQNLGFNTLPLFARYTNLGDRKTQETLDEFRSAGFKILNIDSPFHHMVNKAGKRKAEIVCQFDDGTRSERLCPSYRGDLYRLEIERVARESLKCKADYLTCDIELWSWRGPLDSRKCVRCIADKAASKAKTWEAWQEEKGFQMWQDLASAVKEHAAEAGVSLPEMGAYDFRPGAAYQSAWPFDRLYPGLMGSSQVSTYTPLYPYHLGLIGDEVRADRAKLPRSDVMPWITPGDAGVFPGEAFTWALLECFANGARGVYFWSGRLWDAETLAAYADAIRMASCVEQIICDGDIISGIHADPPMRISGMTYDGETFLLVADYGKSTQGNVTITLSSPIMARVIDLSSSSVIAETDRDGRTFTIRFDRERAKALHLQPVSIDKGP